MPFVSSDDISVSQTGDDIITKARRLFLSGRREEMNKLNGTVEPNATSLRFKYPLNQLQRGSEVEIDSELYRVWSVDNTGLTADVEPAQEGTVTTDHSDGSIVRVNPRVPRSIAFDELNSELRALSSTGLFAMAYTDITFLSNIFSYDLPGTSGLLNAYNVRGNQKLVTGLTWWRDIPNWKFDPMADTSAFPSGRAIYLPYGWPGGWPGQTMQFLFKSTFYALSSPSDDVFTVGGVPAQMQDVLMYGVILRLGAVREIKRNFTDSQGDTRRATEVQAGAVANSFSWVDKQRTLRIKEEKARLARLYPDIKPQ